MRKIYDYNIEDYTKPTEKSFYLLGLIGSDGCMDGYHIKIYSVDVDFLKKVRDDVVPGKPLYDRKNGVKCLKISCKPINQFVRSAGIEENKSHTIKMEDKIVNNKLFKHFIRGYFDGDGTVGIGRRKNGQSDKWYYYGHVRISSASKDILDQIQHYLYMEYDLYKVKIYSNDNYPRFTYTNSSCDTFYEAMYKNANFIPMKRKYYRYSNIVSLDNSELKKYHGKGPEGIRPLDKKLL